MLVHRSQREGVSVMTLDGRLDVSGSQAAHDALLPEITSGGRLVVDMSECAYVASSGLRVLLIVAKQSAIAGCSTVLCGVQEQVWDVIEMTGFEDVLETYPDVDTAVGALATAAG